MNKKFVVEYIEKSLGKGLLETLKKRNAVLAGGALTSIYTRQEVNDWDIYFETEEDYYEALLDVGDEFSWPHVLAVTEKAIMFQLHGEDGTIVQFIKGGWPEVEDIFNLFDFSINMAAYTFKDGKLHLHDSFLPSLASRSITFNAKTKYPIISALRVDKYKERGYDISRREFLKVMMAVNNLNLSSWKEFKEQVSGLYGEALEEQLPKDEEFSIDKALEFLDKLKPQVYKKGQNFEKDFGSFGELIYKEYIERMVDKTKPLKMYKIVGEDFMSVVTYSNRLNYAVGEVVNGGDKGIYCFMRKDDVIFKSPNRHLIELEYVGEKWDWDEVILEYGEDEWRVGGDWRVASAEKIEDWYEC